MTAPTLSLIIPCYNEAATIPIFHRAVTDIQDALPVELEFRFVNDGSADDTLAVLKRLREQDPRVHYISFSRNFGKEAALLAGLENATGDYVVTMDVDLQDPPALLPDMWRIITEGDEQGRRYDCVATRRRSRTGEPPVRTFFARMFYRIINHISDTAIVDGARDYRFMNRKMADAILANREYNRFSKGIFSWVGFRTKWLAYENVERSAGESKWSFVKLFKYSIEGILAYSTMPLYITSWLGLAMCACSFLAFAFVVVRALIFGDAVAGWPSLVSVIVFLNGLVLLSLGIIGLYLSKIYLETKKRPIYIVDEQA